MRFRFFHLVMMVAVATVAAGCATAGTNASPFEERHYDEREIKIFVTNLAFSDVTLYGFPNGARIRLGRVTGKQEEVFTMPLMAPADFYVEIDFLAGPTCITERMMIDPGDHLDLTIQNENLNWICRGP